MEESRCLQKFCCDYDVPILWKIARVPNPAAAEQWSNMWLAKQGVPKKRKTKLLYFEWSPPWHVGWRLSGEGCHLAPEVKQSGSVFKTVCDANLLKNYALFQHQDLGLVWDSSINSSCTSPSIQHPSLENAKAKSKCHTLRSPGFHLVDHKVFSPHPLMSGWSGQVMVDIQLISWNAFCYSQLRRLTGSNLLTFFLTYLLTFFLTYLLIYLLAFFLTYLLTYLPIFFLTSFWHIFWHSFWHIFWHSFWHIFWHAFWHIFWHSFWHIKTKT